MRYICKNSFVKTRYFIFISYRGTSYHGWQIQPNSVTVQKILDNALSVVLNENISTIGAGRTDTGVHALMFCAHFDSKNTDLISFKNLIYKLNSYLPGDISVTSIKKVVPDANARFSAISRTYNYHISRLKDPFSENDCWHINFDLDIDKMNKACDFLKGNSDFTSFCKLHSDNKTNICQVYEANWIENNNRLIFKIKADRFLRNMVRAIVGTMVEIGTGKINTAEFAEVITAKDRGRAGKSAPAKGLFLTDIEYPEEIFC